MSSDYLCGNCGRHLPMVQILQTRKQTTGFCANCRRSTVLSLPKVHKKLIYLDQSFLSATLMDDENAVEARLLAKINRLRREQKVFVVVSDIHSFETSAIPQANVEKRNDLWELQNSLANGEISQGWAEVFSAQQRRAITEPSDAESFPLSDLGLSNPHQWLAGTRVQMTNRWRLKIHQHSVDDRIKLNAKYRDLLVRQATEVTFKGRAEFLHYICQQWRQEVRHGIGAARARVGYSKMLKDWVAQLEQGVRVEAPLVPPDAASRVWVERVVQGLGDDSLKRWEDILDGDMSRWCPSSRLRLAFEAERLARWVSSIPPTNPSTFNAAFGISRQTDIDHLSANIPYLDAVTTDNAMLTVCSSEFLTGEISKYRCRIYAHSNYGDFEKWLDELVSAPVSKD